MQYTLFMAAAPFAAVVSIGVIVYAWRYRTRSATPALMWLLVAVTGWLTFNTLELGAGSPTMTLVWAKVSYLFIILTPIAWLAFAFQYTGREEWLDRRRFWVFCLIPAVTLILLYQPPYPSLIWDDISYTAVGRLLAMHVEHGLWFWVYVAHSYGTVVVGALLIVLESFRSFRLYRQQSLWLLVGALIPVFTNAIYCFDLVPGLEKDYTAISFSLASLAFAMGMFGFRLFEIKPIARATVVDTIGDAMFVLDTEGRLVDMNAAALDLFPDAKHQEEALGEPVEVLWSAWPQLLDLYRTQADALQDVTLVVRGRRQYYDCRISELKGRTGRTYGKLVLLRDITRRVRAEASLRYHMSELRTRNEQLDAFAHTVAHDLKSPMATVIGYSDMLKNFFGSMEDEEIDNHLDAILNAATRVTRIVDSLLLLARVSRQEDVMVDVLNMGSILDGALGRLSEMIETNDTKVDLPERWPAALGHPLWVEQVWHNYISNAIKYGGQPPALELGYDENFDGHDGHTSDEGTFVRFWVRDNGDRLTKSQQGQLFTPFTRLHRSRAEGHGLGLTIVRRIVTKLGGKVGVESSDEGSLFWFTLPAAETAEEAP